MQGLIPFPIPKIHEPILMKKIDRLIKIGISNYGILSHIFMSYISETMRDGFTVGQMGSSNSPDIFQEKINQ